jgi:hypothetical protein
MRLLSILAPSGAGNALRSTRVIVVLANFGSCERLYAVLKPKTPEPRIKTDLGTSCEDAVAMILSRSFSFSALRNMQGKVKVEGLREGIER